MRAPALTLIAAAILTACADGREQPPAPVVFQGTQPGAAAPAPAPQPAPARPSVAPAAAPLATPAPTGPDARGVVFRDGYETMLARQGDSVDTMAARIGMTGSELAAYNGLSTLYQPSEGDELVLPPRADGYRLASAAPAAPRGAEPAPIETAALTPAPQSTAPNGAGWSASSVAAAIDATRSDAPQAAAPTAAAPEPAAPTLQPAAPAPQPAATQPIAPILQPQLQEVTETAAAPQPVAAAPQPAPAPQPQAQPQPAAAPVEPSLVSEQALRETGPATGRVQFSRPVDAPISRKFNKAPGPDRNDGVDFASPAGMVVRAADAGTVALVSRSLGGLGTIVLIRHPNEYLTVYGRVDGVTVKKGDPVQKGQTIATVAPLQAPRTPSLHFEVRRGATSVNPEDFI